MPRHRPPHPTPPPGGVGLRSGPAPVPLPDDDAAPPPRLLLAGAAAATAALVLALLGAGGAPVAAPDGLPDAGLGTGWGLPAATLLLHLAAVVTVGSLLTGAVLVPATGGALQRAGLAAVRAAGSSAVCWAVLGAATSLLTASSVLGLPVADVLAGAAGGPADVLVLPGVRAPLLSGLAAVALVGWSSGVTTRAGAAALLGGALLALGPLLVTGHGAESEGHLLATTTLVVHVVAATLWVGGLLGIGLHLRGDPAALRAAVPVFSVLAAGCLALVAASGLASAAGRLGTSGWASAYGALVLVKAGVLVVLAGLGLAHRRRTLPLLAAGRPGALLRLAAGEVLVMGAAFGLGVALTRTPGPVVLADGAPTHGEGHATLGADIAPFSAGQLVQAWQPDAVAVALAAVALVAYARGLLAVRRGGGSWPARRTACFAAGLGLAVVATCGGLGVYAPALLSVHVARSLVLVLVVPLLLLLGRPGTLLDRARPDAAAAVRVALRCTLLDRARGRPVLLALALALTATALYATPALETSLRSVPAHLLTGLLEVAVGLLLVGAVLPASSAAPRAWRVAGVGVVVLALGLLALALLLRAPLLAEGWFSTVDLLGADPAADQRRAGAVVLLALQVLAPVLLLAAWAGPGRLPTAPAARAAPRARS